MLLTLTDDGEVVVTLLRNVVLLSIVVILSFLMVHWLLVMSGNRQF